MAKLILFFFILFIIIFFPVYENSKINIPHFSKINKKIAIANINEGRFFVYDINISKIGKFKNLDIYKNLYIVKDLNIDDLIKEEIFFAKRANFNGDILKAFNFKFSNKEYNFISDFVIYNLKNKNIKGKIFHLYSDEYNATGRNFFIDSTRDVKADNISFYLKVKK